MTETPNPSQTELQSRAKPAEYLDLGGAESKIPAVQGINEALRGGQTFTVIGGGGSGKTESIVTALHLEDKSHQFFDLRKWTIKHLAAESVRKVAIADPDVPQEVSTYLDHLRVSINTTAATLPEDQQSAAVADLIKRQYLTDPTNGIKHAENYLLGKQLARIKSGEEPNDGISDNPKEGNTLKAIMSGNEQVVILDEFDLGIGKKLSPVEIDTAAKLMQLATSLPDKQIGAVIHPPAREDNEFMEAINAPLSTKGDIKEIEMTYWPEEVQLAALATVGLALSPKTYPYTGPDQVEDFLLDTRGFPAVYLGICTDSELRSNIQGLSLRMKIFVLTNLAEQKVAKNKKIIFDRLTPEAQKLMNILLTGRTYTPYEMDSSEPKASEASLLRNLYAYKDGRYLMVPKIVGKPLAQELGVSDRYKHDFLGDPWLDSDLR